MNARILNVFADAVLNDFAILSHCVKLYLVGFLHELRNHNGIFLAYLACEREETLQLLVIVANIHRRARKHIRRTHQNRESNPIYKRLHVVHTCERAPFGLVDAELIEHCRELVAVFGAVD